MKVLLFAVLNMVFIPTFTAAADVENNGAHTAPTITQSLGGISQTARATAANVITIQPGETTPKMSGNDIQVRCSVGPAPITKPVLAEKPIFASGKSQDDEDKAITNTTNDAQNQCRAAGYTNAVPVSLEWWKDGCSGTKHFISGGDNHKVYTHIYYDCRAAFICK